jgi:peptidoglycan/xylan/chitin deacetylase (PgdA/CDA1 family)
VFTGDEFADGAVFIQKTLQEKNTKASFFFTGNFYDNKKFTPVIRSLISDDHYLGAHSDKHLLYCDWTKRDSLLVSREVFKKDLLANYHKMQSFGIDAVRAKYFLPPYEWYNDSIASWTKELSLQLINFSPGTRSNADYTTPDMRGYRSSNEIFESILNYERTAQSGLNGFILLLHVGTDPARTDKFYLKLPALIDSLKQKGYRMVRVDELIKN